MADELVAEAVDEVDDEDERRAAEELVARRLPSLRRFDRDVQTRRLVGMLARKGYPGGLAMQRGAGRRGPPGRPQDTRSRAWRSLTEL